MKAISAFVAIFAAILVFVSAEIPTTCPEENGEDVVLLPNPDDCSTFYECNEGKPFLMECSPGLEYNPELRVCDYPNPNATCIHRPPSSVSPTNNPGSQHRPTSQAPSKPPRPTSRPTARPTPPSNTQSPKPCHPSKPCRPSKQPCKPRPPSKKPCKRPLPSFYPNPYFSPNWWPLPQEYYEKYNENISNEEYENEEYDYDLDEE
ncbi:proline-rich receptor-like protein kinase PERK9 [Apis laboriosa]|uniref:proline-rich receptor-like protein kinase PERK9 n=1 Tax=Apis laboriosa TaxID=183418 RepID=UPI001CC48619|nr:proline-rich receptor-like protein kinase PERK9 [Apis laboriosa]